MRTLHVVGSNIKKTNDSGRKKRKHVSSQDIRVLYVSVSTSSLHAKLS